MNEIMTVSSINDEAFYLQFVDAITEKTRLI